jgi:1,4-dihydroxy-2-naphthoyl-CoA hydrolase
MDSGNAELTRFMHDTMPLTAMLGAYALRADESQVSARLDWSPERCTSGGILHGGAIMALGDSTGAWCAFLNLPAGAMTSTIESKTNFLRAIRSGYAEAVSRPLHVGRTTIVVDTEVRDGEGRLVARLTQTQAVLQNP